MAKWRRLLKGILKILTGNERTFALPKYCSKVRVGARFPGARKASGGLRPLGSDARVLTG
jgi:hypothetical protein